MTTANSEPNTMDIDVKLVQAYEDIRVKETDLITKMLDILPRIDNLETDQLSQVRDAMFHADHPYLMVFVGTFSSGKSSLINALLGTKDLQKIGSVPTTDRISIIRWGEEPENANAVGDVETVFYPSPLLRKISLVDTPGLESVFQSHEEITTRFLHRSDIVVFVMLATQAMTQSNLDTLQKFKAYGKKVIIAINQVDLLSEEDREKVRQYVADQSKNKLGFEPTIWLVSAKQAQMAREGGGLDEALWQSSGLPQIETYIEKQLKDADRLRQKLQTPLQIVQNVHRDALNVALENQSTVDRYRNITDNIDAQLDAQKRALDKKVREMNTQVEAQFQQVTERSQLAIRDVFQFTRSLRLLFVGLTELIGLARLFRRNDRPSPIKTAFNTHKVFEPIDELPALVDKLAPRLEGQDIEDLDALSKYGQKEIEKLKPSMREKLIGSIQAPLTYDRKALLDVRKNLEEIEDEARKLETKRLDDARRSTLIYFAIWEIILLILSLAVINTWGALDSEAPLSLIALVVLLSGMLIGFLAMPLRGRALHTDYTNRILKHQQEYTRLLTEASDKQIEYSMKLRRDSIAPLTRLVESQITLQSNHIQTLRSAEKDIRDIESDVNALGKRRLLGFTL